MARAGQPAQRRDAERRDRSGRGLRPQADRVGEVRRPLGLVGDEGVQRVGRPAEARHRQPTARPPSGPAGRAGRPGRPCRRRRTPPPAAAASRTGSRRGCGSSMRRCSSSSRARSRSMAATAAGRVSEVDRCSRTRLQRRRRHRVADHRGVAQHRAGVGRQGVDAGGQHGGQVAAEQPARTATAGRAARSGRTAGPPVALTRGMGQRAPLQQQRDQLGQVERDCPGRSTAAGRCPLAAADHRRGSRTAAAPPRRLAAAAAHGPRRPASRVSAPAARTISGRPSSTHQDRTDRAG